MALIGALVKNTSLTLPKVTTTTQKSTNKSLSLITKQTTVKSAKAPASTPKAAAAPTPQSKTNPGVKPNTTSTTTTKDNPPGSKDLIKWSGYAFHAKKSEIRGVKGITITSSTETEDKTANGETYVAKKNAGATEISLTAILDAYLGIDVKKETKAMLESARKSEKGYFYAGKDKLMPYQFMLIKASASNITLAPNGKWIHAEVALTLKQCTKKDGTTTSTSSSSGGSGNSSPAKKTLTEEQKKVVTTAAKAAVTGVVTAVAGVAGVVKTALTTVGDALKKATNTTLAAQAQSTIQSKTDAVTKKTTTTTPKVTPVKNLLINTNLLK